MPTAISRGKPRFSSTPIPQFAYIFPSDLGWMGLAWRGETITFITFGHPSARAAATSLNDSDELVCDEADIAPPIRKTIERLQRFAAGAPDDFRDVAIDLSHLGAFQRKVVQACRRIKAGQARSYGELAAAAGSPRAARAVGNVMRLNRYPLVVPCHRVIGSSGLLGGFSAPEGLSMKERLLRREGVEVRRTARR